MISVEDVREAKRQQFNDWMNRQILDYAQVQGWDLDNPDDVAKLNIELDNLSKGMWR